jgi:hypothetical protein
MAIDDIIDNVEALNFNDVLVEVVDETDAELIKLQQEQLYAGQLASGARIQPEYRPFTVDEKIKNNQPFDRVTLKDQGDFYKGIYVTAYKDGVEIDSNDFKSESLKKKYTEEIFGLNKHYATRYSVEQVIPLALDKIKKQILK